MSGLHQVGDHRTEIQAQPRPFTHREQQREFQACGARAPSPAFKRIAGYLREAGASSQEADAVIAVSAAMITNISNA